MKPSLPLSTTKQARPRLALNCTALRPQSAPPAATGTAGAAAPPMTLMEMTRQRAPDYMQECDTAQQVCVRLVGTDARSVPQTIVLKSGETIQNIKKKILSAPGVEFGYSDFELSYKGRVVIDPLSLQDVAGLTSDPMPVLCVAFKSGAPLLLPPLESTSLGTEIQVLPASTALPTAAAGGTATTTPLDTPKTPTKGPSPVTAIAVPAMVPGAVLLNAAPLHQQQQSTQTPRVSVLASSSTYTPSPVAVANKLPAYGDDSDDEDDEEDDDDDEENEDGLVEVTIESDSSDSEDERLQKDSYYSQQQQQRQQPFFINQSTSPPPPFQQRQQQQQQKKEATATTAAATKGAPKQSNDFMALVQALVRAYSVQREQTHSRLQSLMSTAAELQNALDAEAAASSSIRASSGASSAQKELAQAQQKNESTRQAASALAQRLCDLEARAAQLQKQCRGADEQIAALQREQADYQRHISAVQQLLHTM